MTHWDKKTTDRNAGVRPDGRAVRGHEQRTGLPALRDAVPAEVWNQIRHKLDHAAAWRDVHSAFADHGLRYILNRSGARIARLVGDWAMAACHLGTAYGLGKMQERLGRFVAKDDVETAPLAKGTSAQAIPTSSLAASFAGPLRIIKKQRNYQKELRAKHRADKQEVSALQLNETRKLRDILGGTRNIATQALRKVLRKDHCVERLKWKDDNPTPSRPGPSKVSALMALIPDFMTLRQHRQILREPTSDTTRYDAPQLYVDHTDMRQTWSLAPLRTAFEHPKHIENILMQCPNDIRADWFGNLLLAQRDINGSIVGFEALEASAFAPIYPFRASGGEGVCILGARDAGTVVVVADAKSAVTQAVVSPKPLPLIVAIGADLTPPIEHLLKTLVQNWPCEVAIEGASKHSDYRARLVRLLPHATYRAPPPENTLRAIFEVQPPPTEETSTKQGLDP